MMKKNCLAFAILATLVSCNNDELVDVTPKQAITFGNAFVDNATRAAIDPSYGNESTNLIQSFQVFGTITGNENTVNIFDGDVVTRPGDMTEYNAATAWTCDEIQYWIPGSSYNFTAIVDGSITEGTGEDKTILNEITVDKSNGMPTSIKYNAGTQKDLLLASTAVTTDVNGLPNTSSNNTATNIAPVAFTFGHLLSKVKFTVKNTMAKYDETKKIGTNVYSYKVTDVRITNAVKEGTYNISASPSWSFAESNIPSYTETESLLFGNVLATPSTTETNEATAISEGEEAESCYERLLIPYNYKDTTKKLNVKFTVDILVGGKSVNTKNYTSDVAIEFKKGNAYNFNIELALDKQIKFTVTTVNSWITDPNGATEGNENEKTLTIVEDVENAGV